MQLYGYTDQHVVKPCQIVILHMVGAKFSMYLIHLSEVSKTKKIKKTPLKLPKDEVHFLTTVLGLTNMVLVEAGSKKASPYRHQPRVSLGCPVGTACTFGYNLIALICWSHHCYVSTFLGSWLRDALSPTEGRFNFHCFKRAEKTRCTWNSLGFAHGHSFGFG